MIVCAVQLLARGGGEGVGHDWLFEQLTGFFLSKPENLVQHKLGSKKVWWILNIAPKKNNIFANASPDNTKKKKS